MTGKKKKKSRARDVWRRLRRNKLAMVGLGIVAVLFLAAAFADFLAPYDYAKQDYSAVFVYPCRAHLLGTDNCGRDILSRIIYGGRISLIVSVMAVSISLVIGGIIGATAAYIGGRTENFVMRLMDIIMAIPGFLLAVSISSSLGSGILNTAIAIGIGGVPMLARIVRASELSLKEQEFVEAACATGASGARIIFRYLLPNCLAPIIVQTTLNIGQSILAISSLSFIGLGVQPPTPEWGSMLSYGREYIRTFWPIVTFPGIAIMLTLISFNVLGDGLRDAMDPRLKQ